MICKKILYKSILVLLTALFSLFLACTSLDTPKQWNNPFDSQGTNYHPPIVSLGNDTAVAVNQILQIKPQGKNENVSFYCWKTDNAQKWDTLPVSKSFTQTWTKQTDTGFHVIYVKAINSTGQVSKPDSLTVNVLLYKPVIVNIEDTSVSYNAEVKIEFSAYDSACGIIKYLIDYGMEGWDDTIINNSYTFLNKNNGPVNIVWAAVNAYNILTKDTFTIIFNRVPDSVILTNPKPGEPAKFKAFNFPDFIGEIAFDFEAHDPDSNADTLTYYLFLGRYDSILNPVYSGIESSCVVKNLSPDKRYSWALIVKDIFGDSITISGDFITESAPGSPQRMKLIKSKGESFFMGQKGFLLDESPVHKVAFNYNFWIDSTEVTNEFFESVTGIKKTDESENNYPVSDISWFDAVLFCNSRSKKENLDTVYYYASVTGSPGKNCILNELLIDINAVGYRLPTEAEWEFACRAGTKSLFYWGNERVKTENYAWVSFSSDNQLHEVGEKSANQFGLYDMSGNLWEWCNDWHDPLYYSDSPQENPAGPENGIERVIRGGSWMHSDYYAQSGSRSKLNPVTGNNTVGFRTVLIIE